MIFGSFSVKLIFKRPKKVGRCWQVGSDKERPKGRVGSGSDNARGSTILIIVEQNNNVKFVYFTRGGGQLKSTLLKGGNKITG